jgi:hypothetical protein
MQIPEDANPRGGRLLGVVAMLCVACASVQALAVVPGKVLFDATKAQMAGNADWVIDADVHNVGTGSTGLMVAGSGSDSNPQRYPNPSQANITASTAETYWQGALSSWGVALVKKGFSVETLPIGGKITYGDSTNAQDLSNYGIFVTCEPNIKFTTTEKQAIIHFVAAGGGFFMIADHNSSDRNSDGYDSLAVLNDLVNTNGIVSNVFGITFNVNDYSLTSSYVSTNTGDPLIRGAAGTVSQMKYSAGCTLAVNGSTSKGSIFRTSSRSNSDVMVAYATYGAGKVVACGDSSPFDDGTGDSGDTLYTGWSGEVNGDHGKLAINACLWLDPAPQCPSDLDGDGKVSSADIGLALLDFGVCGGCSSDLDGDGKVGNSDVALILLDFGACP